MNTYEVNFKQVDAVITDDEFDTVIDAVGDYFFSYGDERRKAYNKVYRIAKKHDITVNNLVDWYIF